MQAQEQHLQMLVDNLLAYTEGGSLPGPTMVCIETASSHVIQWNLSNMDENKRDVSSFRRLNACKSVLYLGQEKLTFFREVCPHEVSLYRGSSLYYT